MTFYAKPSPDLVFDLINKANPGLPLPLSAAVVRLDLPKPIVGAGPADLNTTVNASAKRGQGYTGTKTISYRRINLGNFFKDTLAIVNKYKAGGQPVKFSDYLVDFNARYGFSLTADDFTDVNFPASAVDPVDNRRTAAVVVNTKPDSLGFIGAFTFRWKDAPQDLKSVIVKTEIPGRVYPPNNFMNLLTYGGDNTATMATRAVDTRYVVFDYFTEGLQFGIATRPDLIPSHKQFVDLINHEYGTSFILDSTKPLSEPGNLFNAIMSLVTLPSVLYPTANSNDFKRMFVLKLQSGHTWGTGDLFFHHNYGV